MSIWLNLKPLIFIVLLTLVSCNLPDRAEESYIIPSGTKTEATDKNSSNEVVWHVKAIHPEGNTLAVKAIDEDGVIHDVKAIQETDQRYILDIKAFFGENRYPVKILLSKETYSPVKAIGYDGKIYDIKAISTDDVMYDLKGIKRAGNIIDIKAIINDSTIYAVKAISPSGGWNDVKGIKMYKDEGEASMHNIGVYAHVKAIPQGCLETEYNLWHVKAIDNDGNLLRVKAFDNKGGVYDVKAIQEKDQIQLFDIKAINGNKHIPIKILQENQKFNSVKGINSKGEIWDIKALTPDSIKLDLKAVGTAGNILHVKAIGDDNSFYAVKAISQNGQLCDIKGVKMNKSNIEGKTAGINFHAHIKALPHVN